MRKGKQMVVAAMNMQQKAMAFPVPLTGFGKTFDGPPADNAKYEEAQRQMMETIRQRQIELRQQGWPRRSRRRCRAVARLKPRAGVRAQRHEWRRRRLPPAAPPRKSSASQPRLSTQEPRRKLGALPLCRGMRTAARAQCSWTKRNGGRSVPKSSNSSDT